jgi:hypothetical protein
MGRSEMELHIHIGMIGALALVSIFFTFVFNGSNFKFELNHKKNAEFNNVISVHSRPTETNKPGAPAEPKETYRIYETYNIDSNNTMNLEGLEFTNLSHAIGASGLQNGRAHLN